jgi:hypothetical protein
MSETELKKIQEWLNENPKREFIAVGFSTADEPLKVTWGDYEAFDHLRDLAYKCAANGEFAVLPLTDLLVQNEHDRWIPRLHVVDAKCPNDRGEVPLGGAY